MGKTRIRTLNPFKPLLLIFRTVVSFQGCSPDFTKVFFVVLAGFETETEMVCLEGKLRSKNLDLTWPGRQFSSFKQQKHPFQSCSINRSWVSKWLNMWYIHNWLVVWNMAFVFHFIYGMSSFPLTNSIIFQDGYCTTNQDKIGTLSCHFSHIPWEFQCSRILKWKYCSTVHYIYRCISSDIALT